MRYVYIKKTKWLSFLRETKKTTRDVFILLCLLVVATVGDPTIARAALDQDFLSSNNAPFLGSSECEPPKQTAVQVTPEVRVAQTFIVGFDPSATDQIASAVEKYKLGGVFPVGGDDNSKLTKEFFDSLSTKAGAKVFIASDDEGGQVARFTKGTTPSAEEMGKLSASDAKAKGAEAGKILANTGLNADLGPVLDIATPGTPWTATQRDWSSNPDTIIANAGAFAEGLKSAGITPVYKHFPGIGRVTENTDFQKTAPQKLSNLKANGDLKPYESLANKNSGAVMLSNGYIEEWGDTPVGINDKAVQYLRNDIKFTGTIMTDALNALSQSGYGGSKVDLSSAIVAALNAGVDMPLFIPGNMDADIDAAIKKAVTEVPEAKIQAAYQRSLSLRGVTNAGNVSTATQGAVTCCEEGGTSVGAVALSGDTNEEKILSFFMSKGLTLAQASGFIGNMFQESGLNPAAVQPSTTTDNPDYVPVSGRGFGLVQWTFPERQVPLREYIKSQNLSMIDLAGQLGFVWIELTSPTWKPMMEKLDQYKDDPVEAAITIHGRKDGIRGYEESGDSADAIRSVRGGKAKEVYDKYKDKPPLQGSTSSATPSTGSTSTSATAGKQVTIAIDPGHGATLPEYNDSVTKLGDRETNNDEPPGTGETTDVMDVANQVKSQLETAGYKIVLLRTDSTTPVSKRDRVNKAIAEKADMGISIHTDAAGGLNQVWSQKVGSFRENINGGHERVEFNNAATATLSQKYADAFKTAREAAEGREVGRDPDSSSQAGAFSKSREGLFSWGNTPLMMLWADSVPWVYNEIARDNGRALSPELKQKYITGIVNGVKAALPSTDTGGGGDCAGTTTVSGNFQQKVLDYVLPDYHAPNFTGASNAKPGYVQAADKAVAEGRYVGNGGNSWYADCGGFVTTLIVDSGHDTTYNKAESGGGGPTETQYAWLESHWQLLGRAEDIDAATLQPGDVWITRGRGHTFVYIGDVPGINSKAASASNMERVPMAASEKMTSPGNWYRKK